MFAGRKDRQVKVRGYRIELDEIESVLISHPNIQETAVYNSKKEEDLSVEAIVVLSEAGRETEEDIKNFLATKIPAYAVPERIHFSDKIPRTPAGKIDYKELKN